MTKEQFNRELLFQASLSIGRSMLMKKLISADEFNKITFLLKEKYRPLLGSLYCDKP